MSKGIGKSYVQRNKRYHVPTRATPNHISLICDRAFYHDSTFKYKLPRYYRDRLYRMKFPYDSRVWNKKKKIYENKIVYRYASKNMLALQMQNEVRSRLLAEYNRRFSMLKSVYPDKSDSQICVELERSEASARKDRQYDIYSQMSRFYNFNKSKNRQF